MKEEGGGKGYTFKEGYKSKLLIQKERGYIIKIHF